MGAAFSQKFEEIKLHMRELEETIQGERSAKVQALNDLTFKKIEMEKL